jgi:hypothetical protein
MKVTYRDCKIDVYRDKSLSGEDAIYYSVYDMINDGFEVVCGFSYDEDTVISHVADMKLIVDDYREHPEEYDDDYESELGDD